MYPNKSGGIFCFFKIGKQKLTSARCITEADVELDIQHYKKETITKNAANDKNDEGPILKEKGKEKNLHHCTGPLGDAVTHKTWLNH